MTVIVHESDADLDALRGQRIAVVGYGNQGRPWALNLRDGGLDVTVCVRADATRERAIADGFEAVDLDGASSADVVCVLVPDDAIPDLPLEAARRRAGDRGEWLHARVRSLRPRLRSRHGRAPHARPRGPTLLRGGDGLHHRLRRPPRRDRPSRERVLAVAKAIGGLRQGAIEMTAMQEAVLDLAVEQALSPALRKISESFVGVMLEHGIPLEAILTELFLSGEVERTYRLLRTEGYAAQMEHHSPVSQYGQLSRTPEYEDLDVLPRMQRIVEGIASGRFADEWDAERADGFATFERLKGAAAGPDIAAFEQELRAQLGEGAIS